MPIYEYQCTNCGHTLEVFQNVNDEPEQSCPECNKNTLKKLISATSFQLKGTGWYVTDIRDKNKPKPAEGESETKKTDESSKSSEKGEKQAVKSKETPSEVKTETKTKEKPID